MLETTGDKVHHHPSMDAGSAELFEGPQKCSLAAQVYNIPKRPPCCSCTAASLLRLPHSCCLQLCNCWQHCPQQHCHSCCCCYVHATQRWWQRCCAGLPLTSRTSSMAVYAVKGSPISLGCNTSIEVACAVVKECTRLACHPTTVLSEVILSSAACFCVLLSAHPVHCA